MDAMLSLRTEDIQEAIDCGKEALGAWVGCPEQTYSYSPADTTRPSFAEVRALWNDHHSDYLADYPPVPGEVPKPESANLSGSAALGACYGRRGGGRVPLESVVAIANMIEAQQYTEEHVGAPLEFPRGSFGYLCVSPRANDLHWAPGPSVTNAINNITRKRGHVRARVEYTRGWYGGHDFLIADRFPGYFPGVLAYSHGWAGVLMLEASKLPIDPTDQDRFRRAALLAGEWAFQEPSNKNHNYTAKLIWLLAELYRETGDETFRLGLHRKLRRNLLPSVLMDRDRDGRVDGMRNQAFEDLCFVAQVPGRTWDIHNAGTAYFAMNAWAGVSAYVAFRDRGDLELAEWVRPYAFAMMDNLAREIVEQGVPSWGYTHAPIALIYALRDIARTEGLSVPHWEQAAWAIWNHGARPDGFLRRAGRSHDGSTGYSTMVAGLYVDYLASLE